MRAGRQRAWWEADNSLPRKIVARLGRWMVGRTVGNTIASGGLRSATRGDTPSGEAAPHLATLSGGSFDRFLACAGGRCLAGGLSSTARAAEWPIRLSRAWRGRGP